MNNEKIKQTIEELLRRMGVTFESVTPSKAHDRASSEEVLRPTGRTHDRTAFVIKSSESNLLIGARGAHITALNHLTRRIVGKDTAAQDEALNFYVDVNDYHDKLLQEIKNRAQILAGRARSFKANIEMDPMSSYERMIVHSFFQDSPDIKTESAGSGDQRHVVLKYVGE